MPLNLRDFNTLKYKNVIFSKQARLERMTFFINLSIQDELQPFAEELQRYVTPVFLEELAREIGFIKAKT